MRTTLTIDDDVLLAARGLAKLQRKSIGCALSSLARQGLIHSAVLPSDTRNGVRLLPRQTGASAATLALVNQLRDEAP